MKIGIVGHAADKFTAEAKAKAKDAIANIILRAQMSGKILDDPNDIWVVSGPLPSRWR